MSYKYNPIPEKLNVVFLEVIKPLYWHNEPKHCNWCDTIPVGSITWMRDFTACYKIVDGIPVLKTGSDILYAITPENNRYCANFDPSCFKILHTSKQKIKK